MIKLEKMCTSITKNLCNLSTHRIIEISLVPRSTHMVLKNQDKFVFYINNFIDWDQFNQLYDPDWIEKDIKNADTVVCKLGPALIRITNQRLEVAREKKRKRKKW